MAYSSRLQAHPLKARNDGPYGGKSVDGEGSFRAQERSRVPLQLELDLQVL